MTEKNNTKQDASIALDAVRGLAVISVTIYHASEYGFIQIPYLKAFSLSLNFGVDLFFVLSGFFIAKAIISPEVWNPSTFIKNRITRIYPTFIISLAIFLTLKIASNEIEMHRAFPNVLLHLLMLQNYIPGAGISINGVFWTLSVEFSFYIFSVVAAGLYRSKNPKIKLAFVASLVLIAIVYRYNVYVFLQDPSIRFYFATQILGCSDAFALGILAYFIREYRMATQLLHPWRWLLLIVAIGSIAITLYQFTFHIGDYWSNMYMAVYWRLVLAFSFLILVISCSYMNNSRSLTMTGLPFIGKIAYSIYLFHLLPMYAIHAHYNNAAWQIKLSITLFSTLVISYLSWRHIESRFHKSLVRL